MPTQWSEAEQVPLGCIAPYATALPRHISPSGASRHLPHRGRQDGGYGFPRQCEHWLGMTGQGQGAGAVDGRRGRCPHRPVCRGAAAAYLSLRRFAPPPSQREAGRRVTDSHASDVGHWLGMTPLRGVFGRTGSSAPTEQCKGCGGETAGRCTQRVLASLRGHRPLRNDRRKPVCRGGVLPRPLVFRSSSLYCLRRVTFFPERK